jgi:hypothetical protein
MTDGIPVVLVPAQMTYVRSRAEAESLAEAWGIRCYHSKLSIEDKAAALLSLSTGSPLVATYGLGIGLNLFSNGLPISTVDHHGQCPVWVLAFMWQD